MSTLKFRKSQAIKTETQKRYNYFCKMYQNPNLQEIHTTLYYGRQLHKEATVFLQRLGHFSGHRHHVRYHHLKALHLTIPHTCTWCNTLLGKFSITPHLTSSRFREEKYLRKPEQISKSKLAPFQRLVGWSLKHSLWLFALYYTL